MLSPGPLQAQAMGPEGTWGVISRLTKVLVRELEPERLAEVERGLADMASRVTATTDLEMVVPGLIHLLGGDSRALRALKMVSERMPYMRTLVLLALVVMTCSLRHLRYRAQGFASV